MIDYREKLIRLIEGNEITKKEKVFAWLPIKVKNFDGVYEKVWLSSYIRVYAVARVYINPIRWDIKSTWSDGYSDREVVIDHWSLNHNERKTNECVEESCDQISFSGSKYCLDCFNEKYNK